MVARLIVDDFTKPAKIAFRLPLFNLALAKIHGTRLQSHVSRFDIIFDLSYAEFTQGIVKSEFYLK